MQAVMARSRRRAEKKPLPDHFGERLARLRKERGFTQVELAERVNMIQVLISDYELGKLRPYGDVVARFAEALEVSADELLGLARASKPSASTVNRRFLRRMKAMDELPKRDQDALLRTIDAFLTARNASKAS
jgi:transcriptional regulator with XRE-family HTH domain